MSNGAVGEHVHFIVHRRVDWPVGVDAHALGLKGSTELQQLNIHFFRGLFLLSSQTGNDGVLAVDTADQAELALGGYGIDGGRAVRSLAHRDASVRRRSYL